MGLIMLILIGAAPTAYALNRTMPDSATPAFIAIDSRGRRRSSPPIAVDRRASPPSQARQHGRRSRCARRR